MPDPVDDDLAAKVDALVDSEFTVRRQRQHQDPKGWEPGVDTEREQAVIGPTTGDTPAASDWSAVLERANLDPDAFEVIEPVEVRTWDAAIGDGQVQTMRYYKARVIRKEAVDDLTRLADYIRTRRAGDRPRRSRSKTKRPSTYVLCPSDPQVGKEPTDDTLERAHSVIDQLPADIAALRDRGWRLDDAVMGWMGDGCEGVTGFYSSQTSQVVGSYRAQIAAAKELAFHFLDTLVDEFPAGKVTAVFCASNHGEMRLGGGKALTNPRTDNLDLLIGDWLADKTWGVPKFRNVDFKVPQPDQDGNLAISLQRSGTIVGFTHGHQFERGNGSGPAVWRAKGWLKGQVLGRRHDPDVMTVGHYHHDSLLQVGERYIQTCPPLDVGSVYFEEATGEASQAGVLRFVAGGPGAHLRERAIIYPQPPVTPADRRGGR